MLTAILLGYAAVTHGQQKQVKEVLEKVKEAVQLVPAGSYLFQETGKKTVTGKAAVVTNNAAICKFRVNRKDTLMGYKLSMLQNDSTAHCVYNGIDLVTMFNKTATTTSVTKNPAAVKQQINADFMFPFFLASNRFLQQYNTDSMLKKIQLLPEEIVEGDTCWKLLPEIANKKIKLYYFISKHSFLPVKAVTEYKDVIGKITQTTTFSHTMSDLRRVKVTDTTFTMGAMQGYSAVREFGHAGSEWPALKEPAIGKDTLLLHLLEKP